MCSSLGRRDHSIRGDRGFGNIVMTTFKLRCVLTLVCLTTLSATATAESKWTRWFTSKWSYPAGTRQEYSHGKLWPPYARPVGKAEPFMHKYHRNHYWPHPYVCDDRAVIRQVVQQQANNGWRNYTTLYGYHFDSKTQELNQAGRLKLRWIAVHTPQRYRVTYVAEAMTAQDSQIRLANVQSTVSALTSQNGEALPVMLRVAQSVGTPAEEVNLLRNSYLQAIPAPRIPFETGDTGSN